MARSQFKVRRQVRYTYLRVHHLTVHEAREFSVLPKQTPALQAVIQDRDARFERFVKLAQGKVERGQWRKGMIPGKWVANLKRLYTKRGWRAKGLAKGDQPKMPKGAHNPWALYRDYIKRTPDKGYISPWELAQVSKGKNAFDRGQIFIQKAKGMSETTQKRGMIREWIRQLTESIKMSRGEQRQRFMEQRERLRGEL